jgi:ankyrin repeat protein
VLAKYLIDHGLPQSATICYFFFKDQDQNTSRQALCALLHQLFTKKPPLIKHAMQQFREDGQGLINSTNSLWKILHNATKDPQAGPIIIVLDALDECAESEFAGLMQNMESQFRNDQPGCAALKYLLTCRPYSQIVSKFHNLLRAFPNIRIPGEEESETISQEVNRVISYRVNQLSDDVSPQIKNYLEQRLQKTTHRTYLWLYLVFDHLEKEAFKKTLKGVESAVAALPKSVNEAYEQILNKSKDKLMVQKALSIILAASRPLILSEMNVAMNIDNTAQGSTTKTFQDLDLENESDFKLRLRSWCGLFISIYHGKVYFLHQTAREFLLADLASPTAIPSALHWENSITIRQAHNILAELCVLYLNLFHSTVSLTIAADSKTSYLTDSNAFLNYSSKNWGIHFREAHIVDGAAIIPVTLKICDPGSKSFSIWFEIYQRSTPHSPTGNLTNLIIASYYGHCTLAKLLLEKGADIEAKDQSGRTPLLWAAAQGHKALAQLLLEKGADIEAKENGSGRTPLLLAAAQGHEAVAQLLLEKGADIEAKENGSGRTPLLLAAAQGHKALAQLLLEKGANLAQLLLEKGADIEAKENGSGRTPLLWAAAQGHEALAQLLLEKGADIEAKENGSGRTPLLLAAAQGHEALAQLLLEKGADIEAKEEDGRTPLSLAAAQGHKALAQLLLEKGANIEAKDRYGRTPLLWATAQGHKALTQLLLEKEADIKVKENGSGRTPLLLAAAQGHEAVAQLLLEKGANIEAKEEDRDGWTPLLLAAAHGHKAVAQLLLEKGADIEAKKQDGQTPLLWAAVQGHEALAQLLLKKGANIEAKDRYGRTPLLWATAQGHKALTQLLLEKEADIKVKKEERDGWRDTAYY